MKKQALSNYGIPLVLLIMLTGLFYSIVSCGGGGDGGGGPAVSEWLTVYVDASRLPNYPNYYVQTASVNLEGDATCDNCPPDESDCYHGQFRSSAMNMTWINLTTGATGTIYHDIQPECVCFLLACWNHYVHHWWALTIPLNMGENAIDIRASDASGGWGKASVTITRLPNTPKDLVATAGAGQIVLSWNNVLEATSYNLYWSTSSNFTKDTATKIENVSSPFTHSGLSNDVTYYYYVTAVIGNYESPLSTIAFATVGWSNGVLISLSSSTAWFAGPISIATSTSGNIYIFYSYGVLNNNAYSYYGNYLTNAAGTWSTVPVGSLSPGDGNIAVDSTETAHVSYMNSGVVHAVYTSGSWTSEVIDSLGYNKSSLVLDSTNKPHIAYCARYYDNNNAAWVSDLRYATNTSGTWILSIVYTYPVGSECDDLSLAVDKNGSAHIVYQGDSPYNSLQYATDQGGAWAISTIDSDSSGDMSMAIDTNGKVHVAYEYYGYQLKYAHNMLGTWTIEFIDKMTSYIPSLALDAAGNAHISYTSAYPPRLQYTTNASGTWNILSIDTLPFCSGDAIALDSQGKVYIIYYSGDNSLKYATNK